MGSIFWRILKDRRISLLIFCLATVGLLWMYIGLFPTFKSQSASFEKLLQSYPESFMKAFNFDIKSLTTLEGFLSTEQFSFVWPLMVIFMMMGFSGGAIAGEIERGTIELLLSQPVSRAKVYISRYFAGLVLLIVFSLFSIFAIVPLAKIYDISINMSNFYSLLIIALLFGWAVYSIGMFLTSLFNDRGKVFFIAGGLLVLMYVLNIVSTLRDSLTNLKYASFFYYYNPQQAFVYNKIDDWAYLVFGGTILVLSVLGLVIFSRRDIAT